MANWKYHLDLQDIWAKAENGEIEPYALGKIVAQRIKDLPVFNSDDDLQIIAENFECLCSQDTFDDFDIILEDLYDWGDQTLDDTKWPLIKMCWIATSF